MGKQRQIFLKENASWNDKFLQQVRGLDKFHFCLQLEAKLKSGGRQLWEETGRERPRGPPPSP